MSFFVILCHQDGAPCPMTDSDDNESLATYRTRDAATAAARQNLLGRTYGFTVYEWKEPHGTHG